MDTFGVTYTPDKLDELKKINAEKKPGDEYIFEKHGMVQDYAVHLIAFLEAWFMGQTATGRPRSEQKYKSKK